MSGWIDDGSRCVIPGGLKVTIVASGRNNLPSPALFKDEEGFDNKSPPKYWTIEFSEIGFYDSPAVGLVAEERFHNGTDRTKGYFLGRGKVFDGSGTESDDFGKNWIEEGDKIGVLAEFIGGRLHVYFFENGRPLGLAFDVEDPGTKLYPCLLCRGVKIVAKITKEEEIPTERVRASEYDLDSIIGEWKLDLPFKEVPGATLYIFEPGLGEDEKSFPVILKVLKGTQFLLSKKEGAVDTWELRLAKVQFERSILVEGIEEIVTFEDDLCSLLLEVKCVKIIKGKLSLGFQDANSVPIVWNRYIKVFEPWRESI